MGGLKKGKWGRCAITVALLVTSSARADGVLSFNHSLIAADALSDLSGIVGVNVAAGDNNAQFNATAISLGDTRGRALAQVKVLQRVSLEADPGAYSGRAAIDGSAFARSNGAIAVNQASGVANAQANAITISVGVKAVPVSDTTLAQSVTMPAASINGQGSARGPRETVISPTAFHDTKGIVQLNQSAGIGNMTANGITLNIQGSGK